MPEKLTIEEILDRNPQIDPVRLEEARALRRLLRGRGVRRKEYDLAPPFGGHRVSIQDDAQTDPRSVRLKRPHEGE